MFTLMSSLSATVLPSEAIQKPSATLAIPSGSTFSALPSASVSRVTRSRAKRPCAASVGSMRKMRDWPKALSGTA
ncbi:hypothetical protein D3C86_2230650 [compost metagenome]